MMPSDHIENGIAHPSPAERSALATSEDPLHYVPNPVSGPTHSRQPFWRGIDCLATLLVSVAAVRKFARHGATAFEWPGIDMACFFERCQNASFLTHDFNTSALMAPNPRQVFGYLIVGLARLFQCDWYDVYFALRVVLTLAAAALWYLAIVGLAERHAKDRRARGLVRIVAASAVVLVMRSDVNHWFEVAWWRPWSVYAGAHPLAMCLGLLGIVVRTRSVRLARTASITCFALATIVHPAVGLCMFVFFWLCRFERRMWREAVPGFCLSVLLPFGVYALAFRAGTPLPARELIDYYVRQGHPWHYQLSHFASSTGHPWWVSFSLISGLILCSSIYAWRRGNAPLWHASLRCFAAYGGCVALQYVGTEIWPSRGITILGPSRFLFLGYYLVVYLNASVLADWLQSQHEARFDAKPVFDRFAQGVHRLRPVPTLAALGMIAALLVLFWKDDPRRDAHARFPGLYHWTARATDPAAVFLVPFGHALHTELPIFGGRAVAAARSFPFREDAIREHMRRVSLAYGTLEQLARVPGEDMLARRANYFHSLGPADLAHAAEKLKIDYVILESGRSALFADIPTCYRDEQVAVYAMPTLVAHERSQAALENVARARGSESRMPAR